MDLENFMNKDELIKWLRGFSKQNEGSPNFMRESFLAEILADFLTMSDLPTRPHDNALEYLAPVIARGVEVPLVCAIEMVEEVVSGWPNDPKKQMKILKPIK